MGHTAMTFGNNVKAEVKIENLNGTEGVAIYYDTVPFWLKVPAKVYDYDVIRICMRDVSNQSELYVITLPDTVLAIDNFNTFINLQSITHINHFDPIQKINNSFPDSLIVFPEMMGCTSLNAVKIPDNVKTLANYTFYGCTSLESVTTGKNLEYISSNAFEGCTKLNTVILGTSTKVLDKDVFLDCTNIEKVYCYAKNPPSITNTTFAKKNETEKDRLISKIQLYVPASSVEKYKNTDIWKNFQSIDSIN